MSPGQDASRGPVAVCGGGLIGTSLALGLAAVGRPVRVHDRDGDVRAALTSLLAGAGDVASVHSTWDEAAAGATLVVAAVPPPAIPTVLAAAAEVALPDAVLTDVAGVKGPVVAAVVDRVGEEVAGRFVGGHPMAGSERSGPSAGDARLFSGATWVLTPTAATSDDALAVATGLARDLGARVLVLGPEEHDTIVGLVSHLPQLVASVLADVAADALGSQQEAVMAVAGPGFRDTTRIAASDVALWLDIIDGNRAAIARALGAFQGRLSDVGEALLAADDARVGRILARASEARRRLVPKAIDEPTGDLTVPLRDRPGEIARITGALGSAGINIEDLAMRHATAADRGSLLLRVRAQDVARAVEVLGAAGVGGAVPTPDVAGAP